jgi:hypothetical protein
LPCVFHPVVCDRDRAQNPVTGKGMARVRVADAAVAELLLKDTPGFAREHVRRGVRVAKLQHAHGAGQRSRIVKFGFMRFELGIEAVKSRTVSDCLRRRFLQLCADLLDQRSFACAGSMRELE